MIRLIGPQGENAIRVSDLRRLMNIAKDGIDQRRRETEDVAELRALAALDAECEILLDGVLANPKSPPPTIDPPA